MKKSPFVSRLALGFFLIFCATLLSCRQSEEVVLSFKGSSESRQRPALGGPDKSPSESEVIPVLPPEPSPSPDPDPTPAPLPSPSPDPDPTPTPTPIVLMDPLFAEQWHLVNAGQKTFSTGEGLANQDINLRQSHAAGLSGKGVKVLVSDDGVESAHEDLTGNFMLNVSKDYRLPSPYISRTGEHVSTSDFHGTPVAGLIAAVGGNNKGGRGVAHQASLASANFLAVQLSLDSFASVLVDQASGDFDIFNQSWGTPQYGLGRIQDYYLRQLKFQVANGRGSRGAIFVKSAGNDRRLVICSVNPRIRDSNNPCPAESRMIRPGNANFDGGNTTPYKIIAGALSARGGFSTYSSPGSNLWVSAPGGEFGTDSPAILTTDRMSCSLGISRTGASRNSFESGQAGGNGSCNYTSAFNGTSSAAPIVSGAIALVLEANPKLSWRELKHILARTATQVDVNLPQSLSHPENVASPPGHVWEQGWVTNKAGFKFQNYYGFGRINVDEAVKEARAFKEVWGPQLETKNAQGTWLYDVSGLNLSIPDNSANGVTARINVSQSYLIEAVQMSLSVEGTLNSLVDIGQIGIELTSPSGTKSIIKNVNDSSVRLGNIDKSFVFLTNAFYGERSAGEWTLRVIDGRAASSNNTGRLSGWGINIVGREQ